MALGGTTTTPGIRFGGHLFSEPALLPPSSAASFFDMPGLYVVLVRDSACSPRPFRPLYFGESQDVWARASGTHEKCGDWRLAAGLFTPLYRAVCSLPGWSLSKRRAAESALIASYGTPCNERLSIDFASLRRRVL